jgi:hypothetical protein
MNHNTPTCNDPNHECITVRSLTNVIESWKKEEAAWIEERKRLRDAALEEAAVIAETLPNGSSEGYEAEIAALIRARK